MHFQKFHGTGNDFIMIDNRDHQFDNSVANISSLCKRHTGIGADGLISLQQDKDTDFSMTYYNSDGYEGSMCGNGGRCIVAFALQLNVISPDKAISFSATDGIHQARILESTRTHWKIALKMKDVKNATVDFMDTGSPHHIETVADLERTDVYARGRAIRYGKTCAQAGGTNVNFVQHDGDLIRIRTYERGVEDETLSCGTGAVAVALSHAIATRLERGPLPVQTRGGILSVDFRRENNSFRDVWLTGPAVKVFEGNI